MKSSSITCFVLFLIGVVLGLTQLWLRLWSDEVFCKLIITDAALLVLSVVWVFIMKESSDTRKIGSKNSLD